MFVFYVILGISHGASWKSKEQCVFSIFLEAEVLRSFFKSQSKKKKVFQGKGLKFKLRISM